MKNEKLTKFIAYTLMISFVCFFLFIGVSICSAPSGYFVHIDNWVKTSGASMDEYLKRTGQYDNWKNSGMTQRAFLISISK